MEQLHYCELSTPSDPVLPSGIDSSEYSKLKYFIVSYTIISKSNIRSLKHMRSSANINAEKRRQLRAGYWYIFHPFSRFRSFWEIFMSIVLFLALLLIPFNIAFGPGIQWKIYKNSDHNIMPLHLLKIVYGFCLLDVIVNFFTGVYESKIKTIIIEPWKISKRYLSRFFWIDFLSSLPYDDILSLTLRESKLHNEYSWLVIGECFGILKLLRLRSLLTYLRQVGEALQFGDTMIRVLRLIVTAIIFFHWMSLLQYSVSALVRSEESWVVKYRIFGMNTWARYCHSLFRGTSNLLASGYGQGEPTDPWDVCVTMFSIVSGILFYAWVVVFILHLWISRGTSETKYQEVLNQLQQYMSHKQLPVKMQSRLLLYYDYSFQKRYFRAEAILATLSEHLRQEINLYTIQRLVETVNIFEDLPSSVVDEIVAALKLEIYLPNDVIIKAGVQGDCMYFLATGSVSVMSSTGKEVRRLEDGAYFGEIALVTNDERRVASVLALDICEVYRLDRRDFKRSILPYPTLYNQVTAIAIERMKQTIAIEDAYKQELLDRAMKRKTTQQF